MYHTDGNENSAMALALASAKPETIKVKSSKPKKPKKVTPKPAPKKVEPKPEPEIIKPFYGSTKLFKFFGPVAKDMAVAARKEMLADVAEARSGGDELDRKSFNKIRNRHTNGLAKALIDMSMKGEFELVTVKYVDGVPFLVSSAFRGANVELCRSDWDGNWTLSHHMINLNERSLFAKPNKD
ncbi:hypothetical protein [Vibrio sp. WXL210]|uniref:hypothetical protein n=1 Tax=Vibrio sp. WXL210 TaxID=3450709 RepID=UPI003EC4D768